MTTQITAAQLEAATNALAEVLRFQAPADGVLSGFFRADRKLGQRDRAMIAETVYGVLRHLRRVRLVAGESVGARKLVLAWLVHFEGYSLRQLEPMLSGGERQWLADTKAAPLPEPGLADRCDMPDWLVERLVAQRGEAATLALAEALSRPAALDVRVNPARIDRDAALEQLRADGVNGRPGMWSPLSIRLDRKIALQRHPLFLDGSIEVQDEGSQLLGFLVAPKRGEMVADFCAGAGGKTLLLGALMRSTGRLYAFDVSEKRLARFKPRLARSGLSNVHPVAIAHENDMRIKRLAGKMDRVLVDAPCSGFGTLRRNPDLKWRQDEQAVVRLAAKQGEILAAAARLVKPGGRLVYATCSLLEEENDQVVDAFLAAHPDFVEESATAVLAAQKIALDTGPRLRLDPVTHGTDGFFAVVMTRRA